jgi:hypothetical protein
VFANGQLSVVRGWLQLTADHGQRTIGEIDA